MPVPIPFPRHVSGVTYVVVRWDELNKAQAQALLCTDDVNEANDFLNKVAKESRNAALSKEKRQRFRSLFDMATVFRITNDEVRVATPPCFMSLWAVRVRAGESVKEYIVNMAERELVRVYGNGYVNRVRRLVA